MSNTKKLTVCALFTALSTVLSLISKFLPAPWLQGGSVTLASMVPVILAGVMTDTKWGLLSAFVYSLIQMLTGFAPPPVRNFWQYFLVVLLDYTAAFTLLGFGGAIWRGMKKKRAALPIAGIVVTAGRYLCHILSGVLIWGVYAPEGQSVLAYSVLYNGSYMLPEIMITAITLALIEPRLKNWLK